jgi:hypothetical protein
VGLSDDLCARLVKQLLPVVREPEQPATSNEKIKRTAMIMSNVTMVSGQCVAEAG